MQNSVKKIDKLYQTRCWIQSDYPVNSFLQDKYLQASANGLNSSYSAFLDSVIERHYKADKDPWAIYDAVKSDIIKNIA